MQELIKITPEGWNVFRDDTHISRWVEQRRSLICDPSLVEWLKPHLAGCKTIVDGGAYIGDMTLAFLETPGVERVLAFEPNPTAFYCLLRNVGELSHLPQKAITIPAGLSDKAERVSFELSPNGGASRVKDGGEIQVQLIPLSIILRDIYPDFIKLDLEGYEVPALRGMREIISNGRPKVFLEVNAGALEANGFSVDDIKQIFSDYSYKAELIYPPGLNPSGSPQYDLLFLP